MSKLLEVHLPAAAPPAPVAVRPTEPRRARTNWFAATVRWLHIYVSLLGFTALIFFSVTGITLNHPTWFGGDQQVVTDLSGRLEAAWLNLETAGPVAASDSIESEQPDRSHEVDGLRIVEWLRSEHGLRGAVSELRVDDRECMVLFRGAGYAADVYIVRESGEFTATLTTMGAVAVINDLHKGRDTGLVWSIVIDATALLMVFVSITGIVLIVYIRRKRWSGLLTAVAGTVLFAVIIVLVLP